MRRLLFPTVQGKQTEHAQSRRLPTIGIAIVSFFGAKIGLGMLLLAMAAHSLPVRQFTIYSQLLILFAYMGTMATAGMQQGIIRQVSAGGGADSQADTSSPVLRAAVVIWMAVAIVLMCATTLFASNIAHLLVGSAEIDWAIPWFGPLAVISGLGTLLCATLTGSGRPVASIVAQTIGLIAASAASMVMLRSGWAVGAGLGFATGQAATTMIAAVLLRRDIRRAAYFGPAWRNAVKPLLEFSGAFLVTASIMPLTLMAVRSVYQEAFGLEWLGYWLAANRISDVNTQLLGLYLTQEYLPRATRAADRDGPKIARRAMLLGGCAMAATLLIFMLSPTAWITLFLSGKFLPAKMFMIAYFVGDVLRVAPSVGAFTALAKGRLLLYVSYEATAAAGIACGTIALALAKAPLGPAFAYAGTYGLMALPVSIVLWRGAGGLGLASLRSEADCTP